MNSRIGKVTGLVAVTLFTFILAYFLGGYLPLKTPTSPVSPISEELWILTYRAFDVIFLSLVIFATIIGVAALFREEEEEVAREETFIEAPLPEAEEEEE